jgi:Lrp/AsnC family transcriptional regulator, regulator for asnA, asnC and gidA
MTSAAEHGLDPTERVIVSELQRDGRVTTNALAKRANVSEVTARRKLRRLRDEGIVQIVAAVDPFQVGFQSPALVGIKVERDKLHDVAATLCQHPAVRYVAASTGNFHLVIEVVASTNQELATILLDEIGVIDGVIDTETSLILRIYKQTWDWQLRDAGESGTPAS